MVAKMTAEARRRAQEQQAHGAAGGGAASATRGLLADPRGATPLGGGGAGGLQPPGRTPLRRDVVLDQARSLAAFTSQQTPLAGGDSVSIDGGTGWAGGAKPTPAPMMRGGGGGGGGGMGGGSLGGATPSYMSASRRSGILSAGSEMSISSTSASEFGTDMSAFGGTDDSMLGGGGASSSMQRKQQRLHERREREKLRAKLAGLPEPQFMYEVEELPGAPEGSGAGTDGQSRQKKRKRDAADIDAERIARENALEAARLARRSSAVKAGLPRPDRFMVAEFAAAEGSAAVDAAADTVDAVLAVRKEALGMMWHDATEHPPVLGKLRRRVDERPDAVGAYVEIDDVLLRRAGNMVRAEARRDPAPLPSAEAFAQMHREITARNDAGTGEARAHAVAEMERQMLAKVVKLRRKVVTLTKGHCRVNQATWEQLRASHATAEALAVQLATAQHAARAEQHEAEAERAEVDAEILQLVRREQALQAQFAAAQ